MWDKRSLPEPITIKKGEKEAYVTTYGEKWSFLEEYKFGANSMPFYVIVDKEGNALSKPYGFSEDADAFAQFLQEGVKKHKETAHTLPFTMKTVGE